MPGDKGHEKGGGLKLASLEGSQVSQVKDHLIAGGQGLSFISAQRGI